MKGDHFTPTPNCCSQLFERCVGDGFGAELHRELQHLAVQFVFFFGGDTPWGCGVFGRKKTTWRDF